MLKDDKIKLIPILRSTNGSLIGDFEVLNLKQRHSLRAKVISSSCIIYCLQIKQFKMLLNLSKEFRVKITRMSNAKYGTKIKKNSLFFKENQKNNNFLIKHNISDKKKPNRHTERFSSQGRMMKAQSSNIFVSNRTNRKLNTIVTHRQKKTDYGYDEPNEKERKLLTKFRDMSISNQIKKTDYFLKNRSAIIKNRIKPNQETYKEYFLDYKKKSKKYKKNDTTVSNWPKKDYGSNYRYFSDLLVSRFTSFNSYYNSVNPDKSHIPKKKKLIKQIYKKMAESICLDS